MGYYVDGSAAAPTRPGLDPRMMARRLLFCDERGITLDAEYMCREGPTACLPNMCKAANRGAEGSVANGALVRRVLWTRVRRRSIGPHSLRRRFPKFATSRSATDECLCCRVCVGLSYLESPVHTFCAASQVGCYWLNKGILIMTSRTSRLSRCQAVRAAE